MQPHEGPRRDPRAEAVERRRQRALTRMLLLAVAVLCTLIAVMLHQRWL